MGVRRRRRPRPAARNRSRWRFRSGELFLAPHPAKRCFEKVDLAEEGGGRVDVGESGRWLRARDGDAKA